MADEPKPEANAEAKSEPTDQSEPANLSPAPTEVAGETSAAKTNTDKPTANPALPQSTALSDGTVPTVLAPGNSHRTVLKSKASISSIYRKADITTTLLTFVGAVIASVIIFAGYAYLTRSKAKTPTAPTKVTTLDKSDLDKLNSFFNGNSAGDSAQVLTVSSSSLFKSRVAIASDLKVIGGVEVDGTTALGDLTVDKTSTLGITNVRGQLTVAGPLNLQSPAILGAGGTVKGDLATSGNGSFGGSLSAGVLNAGTISVTTLNLAGHINITGQNPSASPIAGVATSASANGNDSSGTVTVTVAATGNDAQTLARGAQLVTLNFHAAYPSAPHVVITPVGRDAAILEPYILVNASNFIVGAAVLAPNANATTYTFDYWVVQ